MTSTPLKIVQNDPKKMPCNIEAEQALIGSILVSNDIYDEITTLIDSNKFHDPIHVKIFETIEKLIFIQIRPFGNGSAKFKLLTRLLF